MRNRILDGVMGTQILDEVTPHIGMVAMARESVLPFDERFLATEDVEWWLRPQAQTLWHLFGTVPRTARHDAGPGSWSGAS